MKIFIDDMVMTFALLKYAKVTFRKGSLVNFKDIKLGINIRITARIQ